VKLQWTLWKYRDLPKLAHLKISSFPSLPFLLLTLFFQLFIYSHVHTLFVSFLPPAPAPPSTSLSPPYMLRAWLPVCVIHCCKVVESLGGRVSLFAPQYQELSNFTPSCASHHITHTAKSNRARWSSTKTSETTSQNKPILPYVVLGILKAITSTIWICAIL
jgi:hypothetical protein